MASSVSLRRRLLALVLGSVALAWTAVTIASYAGTHRETDRLLDAHLAQAATLLVAQTGHELLELDTDELLEPDQYGHGVTFQVWAPGSQLVLKSADAPGRRFSDREHGFADALLDGRRWRVFTARSRDHELLVEVAEDHAVRERIAAGVAFNALLLHAALLPVLALLVWWSVGRALRPLADLSDEIRARQPAALDPLVLPSAPEEVAPVVRRLNELFDRIRQSVERERRFTADASHELRTPVAAVRAQAEVARDTSDIDTRNHALDQVIRACDRMAALTDQLLMLARLDRNVAEAAPGQHDLARIAREVIAELASSAGETANIEFSSHGDTMVTAESALLAALVRNLVANALSHGGGEVRVSVSGEVGAIVMRVADSGPGVPAADLPRLGERFFRSGTQAAGSGLGLSIVRRVTEIIGARVEFCAGPDGRGLDVRVTFPR